MNAAISLEEVSVRRGGRDVLARLSLAVAEKETLAILGPSGCGKTTLLRLILGFEAPGKGVIRLGRRLVSATGKVLTPPVERDVAVVFQNLALWPHMSVHENCAFGLQAKRIPRAEREARIANLLARVELTGKERCFPGQLSGGEQQRVAIARALVLEPVAVLLDEPLTSLDLVLKRELLTVLKELLSERSAR